MKIVIDTNVIFSSFLKADSAELKIIESETHDLYLCSFTTVELFKSKEKIMKYTELSEKRILDTYELILENTKHIHEHEIPAEIYKRAFGICEDIDPKDTVFVAAVMFLDAKLWTGDKQLREGLKKKGFTKVIRTVELS